MEVGVLEQDEHVPLSGVVANAMDETTPVYVLAFEGGKVDVATVLYKHALGISGTVGDKNHSRCAEQRDLPPIQHWAAHRALRS
jgi:hypothetical protein